MKEEVQSKSRVRKWRQRMEKKKSSEKGEIVVKM